MSWSADVKSTNKAEVLDGLYEQTKMQHMPDEISKLIVKQIGEVKIPESIVIHLRTTGHFHQGFGSASIDIIIGND